MSLVLAFWSMTGFSPIHFAIGFILLICVLAMVIVGVQWLLGMAGITIPQPLKWILGILVFMVLFMAVVDWSGLYHFNFGG